ncbi:MAG TPA: 3-dehydroquinate synthase [Terriglobales bacterium]|nr:3-dehydroquinate synthase [Terriglobales bacterium]
MITVTVPLPTPYTAEIERGLLARAGEILRRVPAPAGRILVVVTTPAVRKLWGATLEQSLGSQGLAPRMLEMPDGEEHKNLQVLSQLAEAMAAAGADREAMVLALGGGVVGDVAGMLASIYMRGVELVQIPTTLVAMIDSALGGKTGVNLGAGKNLVGTFHHPRIILVDPAVLATLPEREYRSGMAEAVKYGIIGDAALFDFMEREAEALARRDAAALEQLIAACLRQKAAVVAADEREGGLRRVLNFGHTLGHALESATSYRVFLHGEAVAWGMLAAIGIAVRLNRLEATEAERMSAAIERMCGPLPPLEVPGELALRHAARDKKARGGVLHFVLPAAIGRVEVVAGVPEGVVLEALAAAARA